LFPSCVCFSSSTFVEAPISWVSQVRLRPRPIVNTSGIYVRMSLTAKIKTPTRIEREQRAVPAVLPYPSDHVSRYIPFPFLSSYFPRPGRFPFLRGTSHPYSLRDRIPSVLDSDSINVVWQSTYTPYRSASFFINHQDLQKQQQQQHPTQQSAVTKATSQGFRWK
jgi:hypothetical protein